MLNRSEPLLPQTTPKYLKASDLAKALGVSTASVHRWLLRGKNGHRLQAHKPGRYWLTTWEWYTEWVEKVTPVEPPSFLSLAARKRAQAEFAAKWG